MRRPLIVTALAVLAGSLVTHAAPASATVPGDAAGDAVDGVVDGVVSRVPATLLVPGSTLSYVDVEAVYRRAGAPGAPAPRTDQERTDALMDALTSLDLMAPQLFGSRQLQLDEARQEVGFTTLDLGQEVTAGRPPDLVTVATVQGVGAPAIGAAVASDPTWSSRLTTVTEGAATFFDWGDELDLNRRTPLHSLGIGGQLLVEPATDESAQPGAVVIRTTRRSAMSTTVAMAAHSDVSAWTSGPFSTLWPVLGDGVLLHAFGMVGSGSLPTMLAVQMSDSTDPGGLRPSLLIPTSSEQAATAAQAALTTWLTSGQSLAGGQPIADLLPGATVTTDGTVVRLTASGDHAFSRLRQLMVVGDLPRL